MDSQEVTRLYAIERRLKLLFKGSDEWVAEILNPGPGWETDKALACVREIRALCEGKTAEEVSWLPVK